MFPCHFYILNCEKNQPLGEPYAADDKEHADALVSVSSSFRRPWWRTYWNSTLQPVPVEWGCRNHHGNTFFRADGLAAWAILCCCIPNIPIRHTRRIARHRSDSFYLLECPSSPPYTGLCVAASVMESTTAFFHCPATIRRYWALRFISFEVQRS